MLFCVCFRPCIDSFWLTEVGPPTAVLAFTAGLGGKLSLACFHLSSMALPRWIDDDTCDSGAMLSAYFNYHICAEQDEVKVCAFSDLYMVVHWPQDAPPPSLCLSGEEVSMSTKPCSVPLCKRCMEGKGGYMFRWYHPAWEDTYLRKRREGTWTPGLDVATDR